MENVLSPALDRIIESCGFLLSRKKSRNEKLIYLIIITINILICIYSTPGEQPQQAI